MPSRAKLIEMLQRAKGGPTCSVREWETKVIPQTVKKYLKKYELEHTFNKEVPVNQDLALADRFFQAGLELAEEIGLLCSPVPRVAFPFTDICSCVPVSEFHV